MRVNFNYFISEAVFDFIIDAVHLVATEGWKLLPWYRLDLATATWHHVDGYDTPPFSLHDVDYATGAMRYDVPSDEVSDDCLTEYLAEARDLLAGIDPASGPVQQPLQATASFEELRWFLLPGEVTTGE